MRVLMSARHQPEQALRPAGEANFAAGIAVAGAHGGAGVTTLAVLLGSDCDLGVVPRHGRNWLEIRAQGRPLVLVARNTVAAAGCATAAINAVAEQGGRVAVLAVVSDGLPDPKAASYRFRVLAARTGGLVRVPFVASLRVTDDPADVSLPGLPRSVRRALAEIRSLTSGLVADARPGGTP
jgi:hypothetical protein